MAIEMLSGAEGIVCSKWLLLECYSCHEELIKDTCSLVCRKRHMKCDETKPTCGPCARASRECKYSIVNTGVTQKQHPPQSASSHQQTTISPRQRSGSSVTPTSPETRSSLIQQQASPIIAREVTSPHSTYSGSTAYGVELAPIRWFSLLADDATTNVTETSSLENINDTQTLQPCAAHVDYDSSSQGHVSGSLGNAASRNLPNLSNAQAVEPGSVDASIDERQLWQCTQSIELRDHEIDIFAGFVNGVSLWLDLFDPSQNFSTYVPHLAMHNGSLYHTYTSNGGASRRGKNLTFAEGLMKAILALGARNLSIKPMHSGEVCGYSACIVEARRKRAIR